MKIKSFGDVLHNGYKVLVVKGSLLEIDLKTALPGSDFRKIYDKLVRYSNWEPIKSSAHFLKNNIRNFYQIAGNPEAFVKHPYDPKIKEKMFEDPSYVYMGSTAYNKDKDLKHFLLDLGIVGMFHKGLGIARNLIKITYGIFLNVRCF